MVAAVLEVPVCKHATCQVEGLVNAEVQNNDPHMMGMLTKYLPILRPLQAGLFANLPSGNVSDV